MPAPETDVKRATRLLLKALSGLSEREREHVLRFLIERALLPAADPVRSWHQPPGSFAPEPLYLRGPTAAAQRMLPVRLPERDYERLKSWAGRHEFPMAVVIRGLVERFLDAQAETTSGAGD